MRLQSSLRGDYSQRVPASRPDEIGQLEGKFNLMARQLIDNFERQQVLAEQSARIEQEMTSWAYARPGFSRRRSPNRGG